MKIKSIMFAAFCLMALASAACTQTHKQNSRSLTYDDFTRNKNQTLTVGSAHIGDTIVITLPSNATTGFQWALIGISDKTVLSQDGKSEYVLPDSALVGEGGKEIWTFKALKRGSSAISMEYSQAWQGGTKAEWTFTATVTVK